VYGPFPTVDPEYQFKLIGNAVDGGLKWGITLHDSQYGLVEENVVYNVAGAGIVFETGGEWYNVVRRNFALRMEGGREIDRRRDDIFRKGVGFDNHGAPCTMEYNYAADVMEGFGYYMQQNLDEPDSAILVYKPKFRGANTTVLGEYEVTKRMLLPFLKNENNEVYSCLSRGHGFWQTQEGRIDHYFKRLVSWNNSLVLEGDSHIFLDYSPGIFDELLIRGKNGVGQAIHGHNANSHINTPTVFKNSSIEGVDMIYQYDTRMTMNTVFENCSFRTAGPIRVHN
jgi:hypothetical protein